MRRSVRTVLLTMWLLAVPRPAFAGEADPPWRFEKGPDPFIFWRRIPDPPPRPFGPPPAVPSAESALLSARQAILDSRHGEAVKACDEGLKALADFANDPDPAFQVLVEQLRRLRSVAERLRNRADAEEAFGRLGLKVSGVVARRDHPLAILNDRTVGRGALLGTAEGEGSVYVDEIQPRRVIVRFRGYRIEVPFGPRE